MEAAQVTDPPEAEAVVSERIVDAVITLPTISETIVVARNNVTAPDQPIQMPTNQDAPTESSVSPVHGDNAVSSSLLEISITSQELSRTRELESGELGLMSTSVDSSTNVPTSQNPSLPHSADAQSGPAASNRSVIRPAALDDNTDALRSQVSQLQDQLKKSRRKVNNLESQSDFLTMQYRQASDSAVESVRRVAELEAVITTLREQLAVGLKQRDMHFAAVKQQMLAENAKLRVSNKLLLEQARLTDDKVRRRAADYPRLERELDEARERAIVAESKASRLSDRNDQLSEQISVIRAYKMGVFSPPPEGLDDETDDEEDGLEGGQGSSAFFGQAEAG